MYIAILYNLFLNITLGLGIDFKKLIPIGSLLRVFYIVLSIRRV